MNLEYIDLIVNILWILLLVFSTYCLALMSVRVVVNWRYDKKLGVKTQGTRIAGKSRKYNRTESTPYLALVDLHKKYDIDPQKGIVDFGSGKGRAVFMLNKLYGNQVTGVEVNATTVEDANSNLSSYSKLHSNGSKIQFVNRIAEEYEIKENDEVFFFFNTFHVDIFSDVVKKIEEDAEKTGKNPIVILYFPTLPFVSHLYNSSKFKLEQSFCPSSSIFNSERFSIYKYK